jgi:hypothetical protein
MLDKIFLPGHMPCMAWDIEYTDEFEEWWQSLTEEAQIDVDSIIGLLHQ